MKGERWGGMQCDRLAKTGLHGVEYFFHRTIFFRQATHGPLSATDEHVKSFDDDAVEHHLSPFTPSLTLSLTVQRVAFQCFTSDVREVKDIDVKNLQLVIHTSVPKKEVHNESAKAQGLGGSGLSVNYTVVRVTVIVNG